jgi:hypothetical protein
MEANIPSMPMSVGIGTGATCSRSRDEDADDGIVAARPTLTPVKAWAEARHSRVVRAKRPPTPLPFVIVVVVRIEKMTK